MAEQNVERKTVAPSVHRRILRFLNAATRPKDLMFVRQPGEGHEQHFHEGNLEQPIKTAEPIFDEKLATAILGRRELSAAHGFHDLMELFQIDGFSDTNLEELLHHFGDATYGEWETLPYDTQLPGGISVDVAHAALLHTGKVLFIPADYRSVGWPTPIWDPNDEVNPQFEYPVTNPDYALFCGGHSFLSDGKLLVLGGGGDRNVTPAAVFGFKFDPVARTWARTTGSMIEYRWYPTAVTLANHKVLVTCGNSLGHMELYDEANDRFREVTGDTRVFPNLYPGFHVLPNNSIFYSRTGWGSAGDAGAASDNQSAFFVFSPSDPTSGAWTHIATADVNRAKGMSVTILRPYDLRIFVVGGVDSSENDTYELIDVSVLWPGASWNPPTLFPDGESRRQCNAVLLPDGTVFVSGGIKRLNSPCTLFNPATNTWRPMDELPSIRGYHSVSLLLPSGKVLVAGGDGNPRIEIFSPPYLFLGARPVIATAPSSVVQHGEAFTIQTPEATEITKVVLVRPMAVTHQTDTEQRVIELSFIRSGANSLSVTAPNGSPPHALAPSGWYMLFILNGNGVPSEAKFIHLRSVVAPVGPPQISLSTSSISFGLVPVGDIRTRTLRIRNDGQVDLSVSFPAPLAPFLWSAFAAVIPPGGERVEEVEFAPTSEGLAERTLLVQSNAPGSPHSITLSGRGTKEFEPL